MFINWFLTGLTVGVIILIVLDDINKDNKQ